MYLNITNRCSNRCTFCIRQVTDVVGGANLWLEHEPSAQEVLDEIARQWPEQHPQEIVFCGYGEPTMRLETLKEICDGIRHYGVPVRLNTNGLANLVYKRDIVPELKNRVDILSISLNSHNAEGYEQVCQSTFGLAAFPAVVEFLKSCTKNELTAVATIVAGPDVSVEECRRIAQECGVTLRVREYLPKGYN